MPSPEWSVGPGHHWTAHDVRAVGQIIVEVAAEAVVPRWGRLADNEIHVKDVDDLVTDADLLAEERLCHELCRFLPGSVAVGEESLAADPSLADLFHGDRPVWIIDPIDGTVNFAAGSPRFASLVALAHRGTLLASWTHAPALGRTATAAAGVGATLDGARLRLDRRPSSTGPTSVCLSEPRWWSERTATWAHRASEAGLAVTSFDTAGLLYLDLASGRRDAAVLDWGHVWDHAAGVLLLREAGGVVQDRTGTNAGLTDNPLPMVAAASPTVAATVRDALGLDT